MNPSRATGQRRACRSRSGAAGVFAKGQYVVGGLTGGRVKIFFSVGDPAPPWDGTRKRGTQWDGTRGQKVAGGTSGPGGSCKNRSRRDGTLTFNIRGNAKTGPTARVGWRSDAGAWSKVPERPTRSGTGLESGTGSIRRQIRPHPDPLPADWERGKDFGVGGRPLATRSARCRLVWGPGREAMREMWGSFQCGRRDGGAGKRGSRIRRGRSWR